MQNPHWSFLSVHGHFAVVTMLKDVHQSANGSPSRKSFKHLDRGSEQPVFRLRDTFCICAATGCGQTQKPIQVDKLLHDQRWFPGGSSHNLM